MLQTHIIRMSFCKSISKIQYILCENYDLFLPCSHHPLAETEAVTAGSVPAQWSPSPVEDLCRALGETSVF